MAAGEETRIVLVGKTGNGKSATANMLYGILDKNNRLFHVSGKGDSVTQTSQVECVNRFNRKLLIVDTPGFFDTKRQAADIDKEVGQFAILSAPGPHVIFFVMRAGRFTPEETGAIMKMQELFGPGVLNHLVFIITHTENWEEEEMTTDAYLKQLPDEVRVLIPSLILQHRAIAIQNRLTGKDAEEQAQNLLKMIDAVIGGNNGTYYTEKHWQEAERILQARQKVILEKEKESIRKQLEEEFQKRLAECLAALEKKMAGDRAALERQIAKERAEMEEKLRSQRAALEEEIAREKARKQSESRCQIL